MLIGDINISRIIIYVQKVEEDKLNDREEFRSKRTTTKNHESDQ